ncbi:MAG TPA: YbhB/YbcL family Raf kinase inhibitor-like protein [Cytophagales bacterium]|nr:YbhB/YbcL family Raf kinase inhibitor-like protein [Cytophagales bacterium]
MEITSPAFKNGEKVPKQFTCEGININPSLKFSNVPAEAKSLVLLVEDPDADAKPWVHWLVYNIPPQCGGFEEDSIPKGAIQGICNGGTYGYEGPCPPDRLHNYMFKLYAIDKILDVPESADRKAILKEIEGHVVDEALLVGTYPKATRLVPID